MDHWFLDELKYRTGGVLSELNPEINLAVFLIAGLSIYYFIKVPEMSEDTSIIAHRNRNGSPVYKNIKRSEGVSLRSKAIKFWKRKLS